MRNSSSKCFCLILYAFKWKWKHVSSISVEMRTNRESRALHFANYLSRALFRFRRHFCQDRWYRAEERRGGPALIPWVILRQDGSSPAPTLSVSLSLCRLMHLQSSPPIMPVFLQLPDGVHYLYCRSPRPHKVVDISSLVFGASLLLKILPRFTLQRRYFIKFKRNGLFWNALFLNGC